MALNLNKGGQENSKPSSEKKGLNLSKSTDSEKTSLNLSKEEKDPKKTTTVKSGAIEPIPNKNNSVIFIFLAVIIVGIGLFWFLNKGTTTQAETFKTNDDNKVSSAPAQGKEAVTSDNSANNQGKDNSVKNSTATNFDNSVSSSSESVVSASSNNVNESNNLENSNNTSSKNQSTTSTSAPSALIPVRGIDEKVKQVIRGDFGNGLERKRALGDDYSIIQEKVNEFYKTKKN